MAYLYRHIRLDKNVPFYIGIGNDLKYKRAFQKINRNRYWKNITNLTTYVVEIILDDLTWEEACKKEKEFISLYGRNDLNKGSLVNMTDGGEGTIGIKRTHTNETKEKIKQKCQNNGKSNLGRKLSAEHKLKLREARLNTKHSEETKKKMSELKKGIEFSIEHRQNLSKSLKNKHKTNSSPDIPGISREI